MSSLALKPDPALDIELALPWPPTINHYYDHTVIKGRVVKYLTREGKQYRLAVLEKVPVALRRRLTGRLKVTITTWPPNRLRRDQDNLLKAPLDAMTKAGVFADDAQIKDLRIVEAECCPGGLLQVVISEIGL